MIRALLLIALFLPGLAAAQDVQGRWTTAAIDFQRGKVVGEAFIDEQGRVDVRYRYLESGETLQASGTASAEGGSITIVLHGAAPVPLLPQVAPGLPLHGEQLELTLGEGKVAVPVGSPAPGENAIVLTLELSADGRTLSGRWRQPVDPVTGTGPDGSARGGILRLLYDGSGGAEMVGTETWRRPVPRLVTAFALESQDGFTAGEPNWPEPFDAAGNLIAPLADTRTLFVLGDQLPGDYRESIEIESLDPGVSYSILGLRWDFERNAEAAWPRDKGLAMLAEEVHPDRFAELEAYDVVALRARIAPGTLPGPKTFRLNGAEGAWFLRYGDWRGSLSIARQLGHGQTEPTDYLYPQEAVQVELFFGRPLPIAEVQVILGAAGGDGQVRLARIGGSRTLVARQDPEEPQRYLTDPIVLAEAPYHESYPQGTAVLRVDVGDRVFAQLAEDPLVVLMPAIALAEVLASPRHVKAELTGEPGARGRTWQEVLSVAAACRGLTAPDLATVTEADADTFYNLIVLALTVASTEVKVGEHAAAIWLRDVLADLLLNQAQALRAQLTDDELLGFRAVVAAEIDHAQWPLGSRKVTAPDGQEITFADTFRASFMTERYSLEGEALKAYRLQATRQARALYAEAIERAREDALEIGDCDVEKLILMTGFDFAPVKRVTKFMAVDLVEEDVGNLSRPGWSANRQARAWLDRVELVASALKGQRSLSSEDSDQLLLMLGEASFLLAFFEAPAIFVVMLVIDTADAVISVGRTVLHQVELSGETRFALGASAIIGADRFTRAEARSYEWYLGYFVVLGASGGAFFSSMQLYEGVLTSTQRLAVQRGREVAESLPKKVTPEHLSQLTVQQRVALSEAILQAQKVVARLGDEALEVGEAAAKRIADDLADPELPSWAKHLDRETYESLGPLAQQPHVKAFFGSHPEEMARYVKDPEALELLALPYRSYDDYAKEVARVRNRTPPQGPEFYEQFDPALRSPDGIYFERILTERNTELETVAAYRVIHGKDNQISTYTRRLGPADAPGEAGLQLTLKVLRNTRGLERHLRWVKGLPIEITHEGVPLTMYLNLRAMHELGLKFADPRLTVVKFSDMIGVESCVRMHWLRKTYPERSWAELFELTPHYRYTESFLEQAGYRITGVSANERQFMMPADIKVHADDWFDGPTRELPGFLSLYDLKPDSVIDFGYDIYLKVQPIPR